MPWKFIPCKSFHSVTRLLQTWLHCPTSMSHVATRMLLVSQPCQGSCAAEESSSRGGSSTDLPNWHWMLLRGRTLHSQLFPPNLSAGLLENFLALLLSLVLYDTANQRQSTSRAVILPCACAFVEAPWKLLSWSWNAVFCGLISFTPDFTKFRVKCRTISPRFLEVRPDASYQPLFCFNVSLFSVSMSASFLFQCQLLFCFNVSLFPVSMSALLFQHELFRFNCQCS
jgi:hypothetical protein